MLAWTVVCLSLKWPYDEPAACPGWNRFQPGQNPAKDKWLSKKPTLIFYHILFLSHCMSIRATVCKIMLLTLPRRKYLTGICWFVTLVWKQDETKTTAHNYIELSGRIDPDKGEKVCPMLPECEKGSFHCHYLQVFMGECWVRVSLIFPTLESVIR